MRIRFLVAPFVFAVLLWGTLAHVSVNTAGAASDCFPYTVQPGDHLIAIALRFNTTVGEIVKRNPQLAGRLNWIYSGEVFCLPQTAQTPQPQQSQQSQQPSTNMVVSLEAQFLIGLPLNMTVRLQSPMDQIGTRVALPLGGIEPLTLITDTNDIKLLMTQLPPHSLLVMRNVTDEVPGSDFTVYEIDSPELLSTVGLDSKTPPTITSGCKPTELTAAFDPVTSRPMNLTIWLENNSGRFPFPISQVGVLTPTELASCTFVTVDDDTGMFAMALVPTTDGTSKSYRAVLHTYDTRGPCERCIYNDFCQAIYGIYGYQLICGYR